VTPIAFTVKISAILMSAAYLAAAPAAAAAPGPAILTAGGEEPRASKTAGVAYENISGVNVFRGTPARPQSIPPRSIPPRDAERRDAAMAAGATPADAPCARPFRSMRRMRTQGFYAGVPYPSRRFTQGFYSGR